MHLPGVGCGLAEGGVDDAFDDPLRFEFGEDGGQRSEVLGEEGWRGSLCGGFAVGARGRRSARSIVRAVYKRRAAEVGGAPAGTIEDGDGSCG